MNRLVTVFGASGFVGRHVVRTLAWGGWRIRAVCRRPNLAGFLLPDGVPGQIHLFKGNVRDEDSVAKALAGASAAVNLVGVQYGHGVQSFEAMHVDAAGYIARVCRAAGVRTLVQISAIGADRTADSRYAQTKGDGELRVREEFPDAAILRPSLIFGPEDSFFNTFAWLARLSPVLPLIGGGRTRFQPVHVGDVAAAVRHVLEDEAARGKTFELGGPRVYTFRELLQIVLAETGRRRLLFPLPPLAAKIVAFFLQTPCAFLPIKPLVAVDQVRLLKSDTVVHEGVPTLADLGVAPQPLEIIVPAYLKRFCPKGQFDLTAGG